MSKIKAQLPLGNGSFFKGVSENFSFHASPEAFVTSRILEHQKAHPDAPNSRAPVRAKVLNRNVAIISSHAQIEHVLRSDEGEDKNVTPPFVAATAYEDLMAPFFPSPNLLLTDGTKHAKMRQPWEQQMIPLFERVRPFIAQTIREHLEEWRSGSTEIDLYESLKDLSWKIILGAFLDSKLGTSEFDGFQQRHEVLLRGQFSLMPISIDTGFWSSPRKKGIDAKKELEKMINERLTSSPQTCPFQAADTVDTNDISKHLVLYTSSLAVKSLASLLTAYMLNLYLFPIGKDTAASKAALLDDDASRRKWLKSVLLETERLSPPIVGIMRRSTQENVIPSEGGVPDVLIPKGWDVWLYSVGGGRDPSTYGDTWDRFDPQRYQDSAPALGFTFGAGSKTCLAHDFVRDIAITFAETCVEMRVSLTGEVIARGVRGWLGWEKHDLVTPEDWAADMKQLPTQRPAKPVLVRFTNKKQ